MRRLRPLLVSVLWLAGACATGSRRTPEAGAVLPLAKVRLYESGVAYFERTGEVEREGASLPVPAAHLDDAIKTLVILGKAGEIRHVAFDSHVGLAVARARAGLPANLDETVGLREILESLRGSRVRIRSADETVTGRLVDVLDLDPSDPQWRRAGEADAAPEAQQRRIEAVLFGDGGEFRRFDLREIDSVSPTDSELRRRYEAALDTDAARRSGAQDLLSVVGEARGPVTLGYLAETPVWRTTFRLVFAEPDADSATLQGWALVHNDTDEDWSSVRLELVNGRPDSFLFPLASPRYERRALETPPDPMSSVPQLLLESPDMMWGDFADLGGLGLTGSGSGYGYGSGAGFGGRSSRVPAVRTASASVSGATPSDLLDLGDLASLARASGEETETQFIYTSDTPLDLDARHSAMVPFISESISAEPVIFFSISGGEARHGVRIVNTTHGTLPEGPISVFGDGGFSGESFLARLKPRERQFLQIGQDPDSELTVTVLRSEEVPKQLLFRNHRLEVHYLEIVEYELRFANRSARPRDALLALPIGSNATVVGADSLDFESSSATPIARFAVEPGGGKPRNLTTTVALARSTAAAEIGQELLEAHAEDERLSAPTREILRAALRPARAQSEIEQRIATLTTRLAEVDEDIARLRGHLESAGGGADGRSTAAADRLVHRLLAAEDRRDGVVEQRRSAERELAATRGEVEVALTALVETVGE